MPGNLAGTLVALHPAVHRFHIPILCSLFQLANLGLASDVLAKPGSKSTKQSDTIEIELREYEGGKPASDSRGLTLPLHGQLAGWLELFGEQRLCRVKSTPTHDELLVLDLECRTDQRGSTVFELRAEAELTRDQPTLLGELETREGQRLQVVATRR